MTHYKPCYSCAVDSKTCARRAEIKAAIALLGVTAINFSCPSRTPLFRVGQRVGVTFPVSNDDRWELETWPATVVAERSPKYTIRVDNVSSDFDTPADEYFANRRYCRVSALKLEPINEPDRLICNICGGPEGNHDDDCGSFARGRCE